MLRWKSSLKPTDGGGGGGGGASLASDVLLYVPFTDADGSTGADGYVKSGGTHTLTTDVFTRSGNAVINTDQTKMTGSSTAAYNPAGANSDGWELDSTISAGLEVGSASPLSIQFWFYCSNDGSGSSARLLGWDGWHTSGSGIEFETLSTDYDRFIFYEHTGATTSRRSIGDHVLNANAWNHIYWAFQPSGSSYLGINGTVTETSGSYITNFAPTVDLNLLKTPANADDSVKGYVQEFIVKDTVPYTSNFTPSTTPLVSSGGGTSYKDTILADNPLFYYRLGEASGTNAYDEVATTNNGTYYNTPTLGQTGAISGDSNTSVKFEEANSEYAETVTLSSETSLLPCTIECFVKIDGASDAWAGIVFFRGTGSASGLNIKSNDQGKLGYHWNNTSVYQYGSAPTLSDDTWYYVALVVESTKATFYVIEEDGTLTTAVNTTSHAALDASSNGWKIALDDATTRYFNGTIDEVAIYDQALSQSTVVAHAAAAGYTS